MNIGFIGAGRVGTAFGVYLKQKGFEISGYHSRTEASALQAADKTQSFAYEDFTQLTAISDVLFITTSDDQIENVVSLLSHRDCLRHGQLVVHMSGALPSTILSPLEAFGCRVFSLHPLQAFADLDKAIADLSTSYFCLEGGEEQADILEDLLKTCGNTYFKLKPEQKVLYHASACMLSNYLVTLIHNGLKLMENIQIDREAALKAMLPLINGTIQNIAALGTEKALTGPIARGDKGTLAKQLDAVSASSAEQLELFAMMSKQTVKLSGISQLKNPDAIKELESVIINFSRK